MIFEGLKMKQPVGPSEEEIEMFEAKIAHSLEEILNDAQGVADEFKNLSREEQESVAKTVLEYMEKRFSRELRNLLRGAVTAGIVIGGITSTLGGPGGIAGGLAAAIVTALLPLIRMMEKAKANRFFKENSL